MEENKSDKDIQAKEAEKRQIGILRSGNVSSILDVLSEIRKSGKISVLPEIIEVMSLTEDSSLKDSCSKLLNDIKKDEARPLITNAIEDNKYENIRRELVASCWESGLEYSNYIDLFIKVLIEDDYATSIEAFTVIEESIGLLEDKKIVQVLDSLIKELNEAEAAKAGLINELISVIKNF